MFDFLTRSGGLGVVRAGKLWYNTPAGLPCAAGTQGVPLSSAPVMELVDMRDLGSRAAMRVGSSPFRRTTPPGVLQDPGRFAVWKPRKSTGFDAEPRRGVPERNRRKAALGVEASLQAHQAPRLPYRVAGNFAFGSRENPPGSTPSRGEACRHRAAASSPGLLFLRRRGIIASQGAARPREEHDHGPSPHHRPRSPCAPGG